MPGRDQDAHDRQVIDEFRGHGGQVGGYYADIPLLLLTTTGARSGQRRVTPLSYLRDGGRYIVVAAAGGSRANPGWYHNLIADPDVTVEVGSEVFAATATVITAGERDALFERFAAVQPQAAPYQARTTRQIPVVVLEERR
jgi:deazaflavin-dependent oxidoreductase (nitroreductase family)